MSEMLDKVAKSIWAHMANKNGLNIVGKWDDIPEDHDFFRAYARAAIAAMRDVTKEVEEAGFQAGHLGDGTWEYADPRSTFRAMIEETLK